MITNQQKIVTIQYNEIKNNYHITAPLEAQNTYKEFFSITAHMIELHPNDSS